MLKRLISEKTAALTRFTATIGAGMASAWGYYQPKVPEKLVK